MTPDENIENIKLGEIPEPTADQPSSPPPPPPPAKPEEPGIDVLRQQLADMHLRMTETERVAREREEENARYRQQAQQQEVEITDTRYQSIVNTIDAFQRDSEIAKRDYAVALSTGNFDGVAEAQTRIARAQAQIVQLESGKYQLEEQAKQYQQQAEIRQQQVAQPRSQTPNERFETYVAQFSPRSQAYLRTHPEYATDQKLNNRLLRAHGEAIEEQGLIPDTDAYFQYLDDRMNPVTRQPNQPFQQPRPPAYRGAPAAPVSRGSDGGRGGTSITLSPAEREAARISGVSETKYAEHLLALEAAGEIVRH
jgi:hypothetical protein